MGRSRRRGADRGPAREGCGRGRCIDRDGRATACALAEIATNLLALLSLTSHVAEIMDNGGGDIINISSGADRGLAGEYPAYVASKWGVRGFTGSALLALREAGIRVTLLSPGEVATPMQPEGDLRSMRILDPDDVAEAVIFAVTRPRHVSISEIRINPSHLD